MTDDQTKFSRKVLLIKPEYGFFPIGLAYVMAEMERNSIPFDFVDSAFQKTNYEILLRQNRYLAVATGGLVGDFPFFLELSKQIKKFGNDIPFILGGNIAQCVEPDILFNRLGIDYAVLGEAETAFTGLLHRLEGGEGFFDDLPGVMFQEKKTGSIQRKAPIRLNLDYDDIEPAWHRINMKHYMPSYHHCFPGRTFFPIMTGRGCTGHCSFCSPTLGRFRARKIDNILKEMMKLTAEYNFELFGVMTEVLFASNDGIIEFCKRYAEEGPRKEWFCSLRLDVDPSVLTAMKESGCVGVSVGAESGSDKILKRMKKGIDRKQIQVFLHEIKNVQMPYECNVMVGSEGEKQEDLRETFDMLIEAEMFSNINLTIAYPGTLIYKHAKEKSLIGGEDDYITKLKYVELVDENITDKDYLNISDFPSTEDLHNGIMMEVRRYLKFMSGRFQCSLQMDVSGNSYKYSALCPVCNRRSEIGKEFGNWKWDGLVIRLICRNCFNVSFSRIGSNDLIDKVSKELQVADRILIFGTGINARSILAFGLPGLDMQKIIGFVDPSSISKGRSKFFFYPKYRLGEIKSLKPDAVLITDMYCKDAFDLMPTVDFGNKIKLIPLMPNVIPETLLEHKNVLLIGVDSSLPYITETLKTIQGCKIFGAIDCTQRNTKEYSGIRVRPMNALFSNKWDVAIVMSNNVLTNALWRGIINLVHFHHRRIILGRSHHPDLNVCLLLPFISIRIILCDLERIIPSKLKLFIRRLLPGILLEKMRKLRKLIHR